MNIFYGIIRTVIYSAIFLLVLALPASAQQKNSKKVTLNVRNGTMESILQSIMKQTAVRIVYNQELLQKVPRMDFKANEEDLKLVIRRLLKGTDLTFVLQDDVMVIGPKEEGDDLKKRKGVVRGQVLDDTGKPLAVVTINISGTQATSYTNEEGKFAMAMEEGNSLTFSYVGFQKKTVRPELDEMVNIKLMPAQNDMDEVVVDGFQTVSKRLSASSTYTLKGSEVKEPGATNIVSMLQGKVPGLVVSKTSGSPNAIPSMRLRGTSTLVGNANPIIVVDGIIRENPNDLNPDNPMGMNPGSRELYFLRDNILSKASLTGNSISGLNVNDVESITFLKDASATAVYGTRAANGVILITTKQGKAGALQINYSSTYGTSRKPRYSDVKLMNSQERIRFSREMYEDGYVYRTKPFNMSYEGVFMDLLNRKITESQFQSQVSDLEKLNTDWFDLLFRNSFNVGQHIDFSGGNEKTTYRASFSYSDDNGSANLDRLRIGTATMSLMTKLNRKLDFKFDLSGSHRISNGYFSVNPLDYALSTSRTISPSVFYPTSKEDLFGFSNPLNYNIFNEIEQTGNSVKGNTLSSSFNLNYLALRGLTLSSLASVNVNTLNSEQYATELSYNIASLRLYDYGTVAPGSEAELNSILPYGGILYPSNSSVFTASVRNMAQFTRAIFTESDQLNIQVGQEIRSVRNEGLDNLLPGYLHDRGEGFSLSPNSLPLLSPRKINTLNNSLSFFGTGSYSYNAKYTLNANFRTDASNRFGQFANQRFLPVWSVAGIWNISSENWLKDSRIVNGLSLKGSYGFQGNVISMVGPDLILRLPDSGAGVSPGINEPTLEIKSLPYPGLRWEKTKSTNVELTTSLFNSVANIGISLYNKFTTDAIVTKNIPVEYGNNTMLVNGGNIKNYGYEAWVQLGLINKSNLKWRMGFNFAKNYNKLQKGTIDATSSITADYLNGSVLVEGQPVNTFYVFSFKGLNPETGIPMFYGVDDEGGAKGKTFIEYLKPAGSRRAKINGGFNTSVSYRAFSIDANFSYALGGKRLRNPVYKAFDVSIPMPEQNLPAIFSKRWRKPGDEIFTNIPAYPKDVDLSGSAFVYLPDFSSMNRYDMYNHSDVNVVSSSFIRCNTLSLSYQLADAIVKKMKLKSVSISGTGSNLFVVASKNLRGEDPETDGAGTTTLPITKIFTLSLNVGF